MPGNTGSNQDPSQQPVEVVNGTTFDGVPYQIALDTIAFDHGWSANIRRGRMLGNNPLLVAVKVFGGMLDPVKEKLLIRELRFARQVALSHPSILGFLGTADVGEQTAIVSLYMGNGNMMAYMKANPVCDKKKLIIQVAEAVEFLHDGKGLVHGDIKCTNVLISDFGDALLTDFGLSTFAEKSQFRTATMTAIRQMNTLHVAAPELLLGEGTTSLSKTRESDVYAFGMLILEAISEKPPWGMKSDFAVMTAVCSRKKPERPTLDGVFVSISEAWWWVCFGCWHFDPKFRPHIDQVLRDLRSTEPVPRATCRVLPSLEPIYSARYTPHGKTLVAVTHDASIVLCDIATGNFRHLSHACNDPERDEYMSLAMSADGRHIACYVKHTVLVLDAASGMQVASMSHGSAFVGCVAYSPDGTRIASSASDSLVRLWDAATGAAVGQLEERLPHHGFWDLSFSPDGICLASATHRNPGKVRPQDGGIHLWDIVECTSMGTVGPVDSDINSMEFLPDGVHIVAGDEIGRVFICDTRERSTTHLLESDWGCCYHVTVSSLGRYVASGFEGGKIRIWDVRDGRQVEDTLDGPFRDVLFVAFSPDGKSLVSVADDWKVRVWDIFE